MDNRLAVSCEPGGAGSASGLDRTAAANKARAACQAGGRREQSGTAPGSTEVHMSRGHRCGVYGRQQVRSA